MSLTVSQIASRLAPFTVDQSVRLSAENRKKIEAALRERIRHWTREGLISPIGEKNPGTGRHRQFEEDVLVNVAILTALAGVGMQVGDQREVLLSAMKYIRSPWIDGSVVKRFVYLKISITEPDRMSISAVHTSETEGKFLIETEADAPAFLLINLTLIKKMAEAAMS
jgi:DNA-binding transcriptional MerR regulator